MAGFGGITTQIAQTAAKTAGKAFEKVVMYGLTATFSALGEVISAYIATKMAEYRLFGKISIFGK